MMYPNLKLQLWKTGIRQNRLARMLRIDETMLSRIINGFREPSPELKAKIAGVLTCDARWLFERMDTGDSGGIVACPAEFPLTELKP
jgi:transcriptional regulator with XRE-family HTH domain